MADHEFFFVSYLGFNTALKTLHSPPVEVPHDDLQLVCLLALHDRPQHITPNLTIGIF